MNASQLAVSPCSNPELDCDTVLKKYGAIGWKRFEVFTEWAKSAFDYHQDSTAYLEKANRSGMAFTSMHLPQVGEAIDEGLNEAVAAAKFAIGLGVKVLLFKAVTREIMINAVPTFLDAIKNLGLTAAVQNHVGTAIETLDHYHEVLNGVNDPRLKTVLEVGMFCSAGIPWQAALESLGDTVALVHVKDQIGDKRVPFGQGDVDFKALFSALDGRGYTGEIVVEMEVCRDDSERTLELLEQARNYLLKIIAG